jgi:hypothetical protein
MPQASIQQADVVAVADDLVISIFCSIPGHYFLATRRDARGNRRRFACRVVSISTHAMTLFAPVNGAIGERVIVYSDEFGKLEGCVKRVLKRGFAMAIATTDEARKKLSAKIEQFEQIKNHDLSERRKHKRIVPENPESTLVLADGSRLRCFVIDVSVSGIAVSADIEPDLGTPLAVGNVLGRVARRFAGGFAVRFMEHQNLEDIEQRII